MTVAAGEIDGAWSWHVELIAPDRLPLLLCLIAFILTFFVTRGVVRYIRAQAGTDRPGPARRWRPHNLSIGGFHLHHVVFGVILVLVSGVAMVTMSGGGPAAGFTVAAVLFGIGAALVLDEFALILHLEDVYWAEDGRTSVDAVFVAIAVAGLLVLGFNPLSFFDLSIWRADASVGARLLVVGWAVLALALAVVALLKGKLWTGLLGMGFPPLLVVAALRLSRPHAPWARWHYTDHPARMRRALERERRIRRPLVKTNLWLQSVLAGMPRFPEDGAVEAELDREIHAAAAPRPPVGSQPCVSSTTPSSSTTAAPLS